MATAAAVQAVLDPQGLGTRAAILKVDEVGLTRQAYCVGGADRPGRARWVDLTIADSAAVQAAAILAALAL